MSERSFASISRHIPLVLFIGGLVAMQAVIGGARVVFGLPGYALLAISGLIFPFVWKRASAPDRLCLLSAVFLVFWIDGRAFYSPVPYLARHDLLLATGTFLAYLTSAVFITGLKWRLRLIGILLICAVIHAGVGAVQYKQADNFMLLPGIFRPDYGWRASGFYICPNHLAGLLETLGLVALSLVCWNRATVLMRVVLAYCVIICIGGLALTGSRGGYLSFTAGLCTFAALSLWAIYRQKRQIFWQSMGAALIGVVAIIGAALFIMTKSYALQTRLGQVYDPTNMRLLMWQAALTQFHLEPLIGTGAGTYLYFGRLYRSALVQNDPMHVHNDYLEVLCEYGLIGAVLFGCFLLFHLISGFRGMSKASQRLLIPSFESTNSELALIIGILSAVVALMVHSIVDFNMHIPATALVIALFFGILAQPNSSESDGKKSSQILRWTVPTVGLALLLLCFRFFPGEYFAEKARVSLREDKNEDARIFAERGLVYEKENPNLFGYLGEANHFLARDAADPAEQEALHEAATEAYRAGLQLFPRDTGLLLKLAQTLTVQERFAEADDVFHRVLECDPYFGLAYAYYGLYWQMRKRMKSAEFYFRKASSLGEVEISQAGLARIEQMRKSPTGQLLMSLFPEPDMEPLQPETPRQ